MRGEELGRAREELQEVQAKLRLYTRGSEIRRRVVGVGKALRHRF